MVKPDYHAAWRFATVKKVLKQEITTSRLCPEESAKFRGKLFYIYEKSDDERQTAPAIREPA